MDPLPPPIPGSPTLLQHLLGHPQPNHGIVQPRPPRNHPIPRQRLATIGLARIPDPQHSPPRRGIGPKHPVVGRHPALRTSRLRRIATIPGQIEHLPRNRPRLESPTLIPTPAPNPQLEPQPHPPPGIDNGVPQLVHRQQRPHLPRQSDPPNPPLENPSGIPRQPLGRKRRSPDNHPTPGIDLQQPRPQIQATRTRSIHDMEPMRGHRQHRNPTPKVPQNGRIPRHPSFRQDPTNQDNNHPSRNRKHRHDRPI